MGAVEEVAVALLGGFFFVSGVADASAEKTAGTQYHQLPFGRPFEMRDVQSTVVM